MKDIDTTVDNLIYRLEGVLPEFQNKHYDTFEVRVDLMIEDMIRSLKEVKTNYDNLVKVSVETAFDGNNEDTEFLLRTLLSQNKVLFDDTKKEYINPFRDKEFNVNNIMYGKEKVYLINDDKLDDYTKQLENKHNSMINRIDELIVEYKNLMNDPRQIYLDNYNELRDACETIISVAKYIKTGTVEEEKRDENDKFSRAMDMILDSVMKDFGILSSNTNINNEDSNE